MGGELMTIETVDNVLHALMSAGGEKIDWKDGESRSCPNGSWSISESTDCSHFGHLDETITKRLSRLDITVNQEINLQVIFDPESRRNEALEIYESTTARSLLILMFWPGLESAKKLAIAAIDQWQRAIEDGWYESD